jgi:hypothetical protein
VLAGRLRAALHDAGRLGGERNPELSGDPDFRSTQIHGWSRRARKKTKANDKMVTKW